jgi:hypothetical protein
MQNMMGGRNEEQKVSLRNNGVSATRCFKVESGKSRGPGTRFPQSPQAKSSRALRRPE